MQVTTQELGYGGWTLEEVRNQDRIAREELADLKNKILELQERETKLVEAAKILCKKHGAIAFAVGSGMNPRNSDWEDADDALSKLRAIINKAEGK